ncbi:MAG: type II toxin-antitoxin system VapC family toxin [Burkholderiales bacterium]
MIALDTNILARIVARDNARQASAAAALIDSGESFFVPLTVTLELEWVLRGSYRTERAKILEGLNALLAIRNLHFEQEAFIVEALHLYEAGFDFADALHHAGSQGCAGLVTFDKDLVKAAARHALAPPIQLLQS